MICKPTYKAIRYNSLEELYKANGVNIQQAQQLYGSYLQTTNNPTVEGFKQWNNRQQQINELFESNPELANAVYSKILANSGISGENLLSLLLKDNIIEKQCS